LLQFLNPSFSSDYQWEKLTFLGDVKMFHQFSWLIIFLFWQESTHHIGMNSGRWRPDLWWWMNFWKILETAARSGVCLIFFSNILIIKIKFCLDCNKMNLGLLGRRHSGPGKKWPESALYGSGLSNESILFSSSFLRWAKIFNFSYPQSHAFTP